MQEYITMQWENWKKANLQRALNPGQISDLDGQGRAKLK